MINLIIYICILVLTIVMTFIAIILTLDYINKNRYKTYKHYGNIDNNRQYYEDQIYKLQMELSDNERRWSDIYHLIVNGQGTKKILNSLPVNELFSSAFFENLGIDIKNVEIEKKSIFILTPFSKKEEQTYNVINKACNDVNLTCSRGDEVYRDGNILSHIIKSILQSNIVIANVNGRNPNVFYELGICHTIGKPVIIVSKTKTGLPFDINAKNIIFYRDPQDLEEQLKEELLKIFIKNQ